MSWQHPYQKALAMVKLLGQDDLPPDPGMFLYTNGKGAYWWKKKGKWTPSWKHATQYKPETVKKFHFGKKHWVKLGDLMEKDKFPHGGGDHGKPLMPLMWVICCNDLFWSQVDGWTSEVTLATQYDNAARNKFKKHPWMLEIPDAQFVQVYQVVMAGLAPAKLFDKEKFAQLGHEPGTNMFGDAHAFVLRGPKAGQIDLSNLYWSKAKGKWITDWHQATRYFVEDVSQMVITPEHDGMTWEQVARLEANEKAAAEAKFWSEAGKEGVPLNGHMYLLKHPNGFFWSNKLGDVVGNMTQATQYTEEEMLEATSKGYLGPNSQFVGVGDLLQADTVQAALDLVDQVMGTPKIVDFGTKKKMSEAAKHAVAQVVKISDQVGKTGSHGQVPLIAGIPLDQSGSMSHVMWPDHAMMEFQEEVAESPNQFLKEAWLKKAMDEGLDIEELKKQGLLAEVVSLFVKPDGELSFGGYKMHLTPEQKEYIHDLAKEMSAISQAHHFVIDKQHNTHHKMTKESLKAVAKVIAGAAAAQSAALGVHKHVHEDDLVEAGITKEQAEAMGFKVCAGKADQMADGVHFTMDEVEAKLKNPCGEIPLWDEETACTLEAYEEMLGLMSGEALAHDIKNEIKDVTTPMVKQDEFQEFFDGYVQAALWSSNDGEGTPLDNNYGPDDVEDETGSQMLDDCFKFFEENKARIEDAVSEGDDSIWRHAGRCFWLSRNGHGSGFFDSECWDDEAKKELQQHAEQYGEVSLDAWEGKVHAI